MAMTYREARQARKSMVERTNKAEQRQRELWKQKEWKRQWEEQLAGTDSQETPSRFITVWLDEAEELLKDIQ